MCGLERGTEDIQVQEEEYVLAELRDTLIGEHIYLDLILDEERYWRQSLT